MAFCIHCHAEIADGSKFCSACGKKQAVRYRQVFDRGNMKEEEFLAKINAWFAQYPHVANVTGEFLLTHGTGLLVNKYVLQALAIEYEVFSGENENQYGVVALKRFGLIRTETDELLAEWLKANPGATVVHRQGGGNQRGNTGSLAFGGFGANNNTQLYVLFKFDRKRGTGVPALQ